MNCYNFSGGIVNRKSPYLMKNDEALHICNFEIEGGGLTVRPGTRKLYGPFMGEVETIYKALSTKGHEILFVKSKEYVELVVGGTRCNLPLFCLSFQVLPVLNGFLYILTGQPRSLKPLYRRCDDPISILSGFAGYVVLEKLEEDYTTDGEFPSDLYGKNIWDTDSDTLYYGVGHTEATKENIRTLLTGAAFVAIGKLGDMMCITYKESQETKLDFKTLYYGNSKIIMEKVTLLNELFDIGTSLSPTATLACSCPYFVWHPVSMRYFAAGHPDYPAALFISEPNSYTEFSEHNVLYPHLNLGKITALAVVEKSVVVCYEHGWSHYVGADPTEDAQWSLLSVPDGTKFGETVCLTPGSVSFFSRGELMSFSSSMLTVQMIYSPSSSLYKFLSKEKVSLPNPRKAFAYYKDGNYYLVLDDKMYLYHFSLGAFTCYEGISCQCLTEDFEGRLLMGNKNCVVCFDSELSTDYDPKTGECHPILYDAKFPVLGAVSENELARCTEVVVKHCGGGEELNCTVRLTSEREHCEGKIVPSNHLQYGISLWNRRYYDSQFSETVFPWRVSGNIFLLEISGETSPVGASPFSVLNVYLELKKERNKL